MVFIVIREDSLVPIIAITTAFIEKDELPKG